MSQKLSKKDYLRIYTCMLDIRRFEERVAQLYGMGHIGGFCHLYIGQEAVVVGVMIAQWAIPRPDKLPVKVTFDRTTM